MTVVRIVVLRAIADGLAVRVAIPLAVVRLSTAVDLMLRVSERAIAEALVACHDADVLVEPSASAAVASLRERPELALDGPIVLVLTGRNVDPETVDAIDFANRIRLARAATAAASGTGRSRALSHLASGRVEAYRRRA